MGKAMNKIQDASEEKLGEFVWQFFNSVRGAEESSVVTGLLPWFLYSTYISQNIELLGIEDFDESYSLRSARNSMGNSYTPSAYLEYFATLSSTGCNLPNLTIDSITKRATMKLLSAWFAFLGQLNLKDDETFAVAHSLRSLLFYAPFHSSLGRQGGEYTSNSSIAEMMLSFSSVEGQILSDFMCGNAATLSLALEKGAKEVHGTEINETSANMARIACFFGNPQAVSEIQLSNVFESRLPKKSSANVVCVAPPFAVRIKDTAAQDQFYHMWEGLFDEEAPKVRTLEEFSFIRALWELNDDGLGILHTSTGFLYRSGRNETAIRNALVRNGFIQAVIELPAGLAYGTSISTALFVIGRKRKFKDILLVNMDSEAIAESGYCTRDRGRRSACITPEGIKWLKETVLNRQSIPLVSQKITVEDYLEGGSVLSYARYGEVVNIEDTLGDIRAVSEICEEIKSATDGIDDISNRIREVVAKLKTLS